MLINLVKFINKKGVESSFNSSEELGLLVLGLESTVTHLGGSIDELKVDLFEGSSGDLRHQGLSQHQDFFLGTNNTSLHHQEVISDHTVVGEPTHRGDVFISQVSISTGVVSNSANGGFTNSVHLLVHLGSMVISTLTSSGHSESYSSGMPRSDTTNFSITSM
jgi:hypothetical protein